MTGVKRECGREAGRAVVGEEDDQEALDEVDEQAEVGAGGSGGGGSRGSGSCCGVM